MLFNGDHRSEPVNAIIYPSVAFRAGVNFAIQPEAYQSKMKLVETETNIIEITDVVGYGIYGRSRVATLKSVNSAGLLDWKTA